MRCHPFPAPARVAPSAPGRRGGCRTMRPTPLIFQWAAPGRYSSPWAVHQDTGPGRPQWFQTGSVLPAECGGTS